MDVTINGVRYIPEPPVLTDGGLLAALDVRFDSDAGSNITVREYLQALLTTVWEEKESFSGKRPFGNSGWEHEVFTPLVKAGFISGTFDETYAGQWADVDNYDKASDYVSQLILAVFYGVTK